MKKVIIMLSIIMLVMSCTACFESKSGYTPLTKQDKEAHNLVDYENTKYGYKISYPDIYDDKEKFGNGIVLTSDESVLTVWADKNVDNITLEDSYNEALTIYNEPSSGGCYKNSYCFNYKSDGKCGYYYVMLYNNIFYRFTILYPDDKEEGYKEFYQSIERYFLVE